MGQGGFRPTLPRLACFNTGGQLVLAPVATKVHRWRTTNYVLFSVHITERTQSTWQ